MERVLEHLLEDKKRVEKEEQELWKQLLEDNTFKEAFQSESFKKWVLQYIQYSKFKLGSPIIKWRKAIEKIQTLNRLITEVEEKNTQWRIFEKLKSG